VNNSFEDIIIVKKSRHIRLFFTIELLRIVIFLFLFLLTTSALSQAFFPENKFRIGIKGGLNLAQIYVEQWPDRNSREGINSGVFFKIPLGTFVSVEPELLYSQKGVTINSFPRTRQSSNLKLDYMEVPLFISLDLGSVVDIKGGFYGGYLIHHKNDAGFEGISDYRRLDAGFSAAFSFEFKYFIAGLQYSQGLVPVANSASSRAIAGDAVNSVIQFFLGFHIF
jgi:hypothetical protein